MIQSLRAIRLTRLQLGSVATVSALATALVIASAMGSSNVPRAVIAALRHPIVVHSHPSSATAATADPATGSSSIDTAATSPVGDSGASSTTSASPVASAASASGSGSGSGSGSASASASGSASDAGNGSTSTPSAGATDPATAKASKVKHVFVIALSTTSYKAAFGPGSVATYLNGTLKPAGTLLSGYETLGAGSLPDYLALISGQAPNAETRAGCPSYTDFPPSAKPAADGQVSGAGCVYPNTVTTIGDQVTASGSQWKAYLDDMGTSTCAHPNSGALDSARLPGAGDQYATRHNPFIYFHSLLDLGDCSADDVALDQLPADLRSAAKTPRYAYIAPGLCADASQQTCPGGTPGGLSSEDAFLRQWVPQILASAAYKSAGVLIVAFTAPATPANRTARTGALVLSRYATAGHTIATRYDPYSLLRSIESLLGYKPLAHAGSASSFAAAALPRA